MKIEEMYSAHVLENDPDRKDSYPFVVDCPPRYDGDLKELVMTISRKLIGNLDVKIL